MNRLDDTIDNIALKISDSSRPSKSKENKLYKISRRIKNEINNYRDKRILEVIVGGSFAKGTWLENDADIDFFVMIESTVERKEFEDLGKLVGFYALKKYKPYLRYSEHPYVEGKVDGIRINIVPCYKVEKNRWKSAADRSPFHTKFMQSKLDDFLKNQVRVLKKFLKSIGIYGSQISVSGFSGYVTEVLVLKYRSFRNVLQIFADYNPNYVISSESINPKIIEKFDSPIIIIDPIDSNRNLGAAISSESLAKFVLASRLFMKRPSIEFFKKSSKSTKDIVFSIKSNLLIIELKVRKRSPDILWGQLKRKLISISKQLQNSGFKIIKKNCFTDEQERAVFIFMIESTNLSKVNLNLGPEIFRKTETNSFIKKRGKTSLLIWPDNMRIVSLEETKETSIKAHVRQLIEKDIESSNPTGVTLDLRDGYSVYLGNERKLGGFVSSAIDFMIRDGEFIKISK